MPIKTKGSFVSMPMLCRNGLEDLPLDGLEDLPLDALEHLPLEQKCSFMETRLTLSVIHL